MSVNQDTNRPLRERLRTLRYHREGNCTDDENPALARIHQLESVLHEGQLWDAYDMEIKDPVTGTISYGKCLWYGPRLSNVLLKGREPSFKPWDSDRQCQYNVGTDTVSCNSRGVPLGRSGGKRKVPFSSQGYSTGEFSSEVFKTPDMLDHVVEQMAGTSHQESPPPKRARYNLGC